MDNQHGPPLTWACYHGKIVEELKQSLLLTVQELETTRLKAQEELKMRDDQLIHLKYLLTQVNREKEEAQHKYQKLLFEKVLLQQQQQQLQQYQHAAPYSGISSTDQDEPRRGLSSGTGLSSSDCEESIASPPLIDINPQPQAAPIKGQALVVPDQKPLPEKGKLLEAVMKAGPLLQTLLLAGPLPQWSHPPPPLDLRQIPPPPVAIPPPPPNLLPLRDTSPICCGNRNTDLFGRVDNRRSLCESSYSPTRSRYQGVVLQ